MSNQVIFITGCANGIGKHLAERLLLLDYQLVATDIDFEKLKENPNFQNKKTLLLELDVSKIEAWEQAIDASLQKFRKIDILINNAGVIIPGFLEDFSLKEIDFQIDINLKGAMYGTKFAADLMLKQGFGHIINFASLAGVAPIEGLPIYSASKFGVRGFTIAVANELKQKGISVSVVCPDLVATNMLTVQLDYEAANLTFSGDKVLTVNQIADAVIERSIHKKEVEILIPRSRGLLAKIGNFYPSITNFLTKSLSKKGNKNRLKMKG